MTLTLVVDYSVIVKWLNSTDEKDIEKADRILTNTLRGEIELIAPELAKYEVGNVLLLKKKLTAKEIIVPISALYSYPIQFISESEELARQTYKIAQQAGITYYDASFIALAQQENAVLVTENIKHQGKPQGVKVTSLRDY